MVIMSKNKKLRAEFKNKRCLVCNTLGCDFAHIKTYATTGSDSLDNSFPLCRKHHTEQGQIGICTFILKYPKVFDYVDSLGFEVVEIFGIKKLYKKEAL